MEKENKKEKKNAKRGVKIVNKTKEKKESLECKREWIMGAIFLLAVIAGIVFLWVTHQNTSENAESNQSSVENNEVEESTTPSSNITEENIIEAYGMTKEDAKKLIQALFNSDNYEFSVEITKEAKYLVIANNRLDQQAYRFEVNPMNRTYVEI